MSNDKKLPVPYHKTETAPTPIDRVHTPVHKQTLVGRVASAFTARLNRHTIERHTEEVDALTKHQEAETALAKATLERDRAFEHYTKHRDDILKDDDEKHRQEMEANREARIDAKQEREHKRKLRSQQREQELNQATFAAATTRFGLNVYQQTRPHRLDELEQKAKEGTYDAELDMLISLNEVSKERTSQGAPKAPPAQHALETMLAELNHEIETAHATGASDEVIAALYGTRARLSALMEKDQSR